jgi:hypothetical protein
MEQIYTSLSSIEYHIYGIYFKGISTATIVPGFEFKIFNTPSDSSTRNFIVRNPFPPVESATLNPFPLSLILRNRFLELALIEITI